MENWREYQEKEDLKKTLLEDLDYVTGVLGIQIPLDESGDPQFTEELKEEILAEHILYEGFKEAVINKARELGAVVVDMAAKGKDKVVETAVNTKNLFVSLYKVVRDRENINTAIELLDKDIMTPVANKFIEFFDKVMAHPLVKPIIKVVTAVYEKLKGAIKLFVDMASDWKKALFGCALAIGLSWLWNKFGKKIGAFLLGKVTGNLREYFTEIWGEMQNKLGELGPSILKAVTNVETYIKLIVGIGGAVTFAANVLAPMTKELALGNPAEEVPPGTPIK